MPSIFHCATFYASCSDCKEKCGSLLWEGTTFLMTVYVCVCVFRCESITKIWKVKISQIEKCCFWVWNVSFVMSERREQTGCVRVYRLITFLHVWIKRSRETQLCLFCNMNRSFLCVCSCSLIFLPEWKYPVLTRLSFSFSSGLRDLNKYLPKKKKKVSGKLKCVFLLDTDIKEQDDMIRIQRHSPWLCLPSCRNTIQDNKHHNDP